MSVGGVLKGTLAWAALRSGALALYRAGFERGRAILFLYHRVNDAADPLFPALPLARFRDQLDYVSGRYVVEPLDAVLDWLASGARGRPRAALTIDDGYSDTVECALPELERRGLPATLYLSTSPPETGQPLWTDRVRWIVKHASASCLVAPELGLPGLGLDTVEARVTAARAVLARLKNLGAEAVNGAVEALESQLGPEGPPLRPLDWEQVRRLVRGPFDLGAHAHRHYVLSRLDDRQLADEIETSVELIRRRTGVRVTSFAYPNGLTADFDERAVEVLRRLGLRAALTAEPGFALPGADPYRLPRIYTSERSIGLFAARIAGLAARRKPRAFVA